MMEETKKCPYCGEEILAVAKKCKSCGEWLDKEPVKKKMITCPVCGEQIEEGTEVCPYCHEKVSGNQTPQTVEPAPSYHANDQKPQEPVADNSSDESSSYFEKYVLDPFIVQYGDFKGRATRKQFWLSMLNMMAFVFIMALIVSLLGDIAILRYPIFKVIYVAILIPMFALMTRRLNDAGKSWAFLFLWLIPLVGQIVLIILWCQESVPDKKVS
jgi:uncharacterized membrane protein YhaH (DUF805 family)/DNA-directed RNA polymerase subunit RPC12/RpoP